MVGHSGSCAGVKDSITEYTMANAFENKLKDWRNQILSGPVGKFFHWWFDELRQSLPQAWQQKLQHALRRVTLHIDQDSLQLGVDENRSLLQLESFSLTQGVALQQQQINDLLIEQDLSEAPRYLLLDSEAVLSKEMLLPAAAEANLSQVLSFEMDRQTPFRAKDIYFDWKILESGSDTGQIRVGIFLVPRSEINKTLRALQIRNLAPAGIDILDHGRTMGLNLLPTEQRVRQANKTARFNLVLAGAAVILLALVMAQSLYLRSHQVAELEAAIAEVQSEARRVQRIKEQIGDSSEAATFLTVRRDESPLAIEVLADITRILPDDTYLDRLVIGQTNVQIQGKSQNAQQLIEKVNESELFDAASFRGSTRLDARSGLEIFEVNANISSEGGG
jgi:general secretion pathway protein L